MKVCVGALLAVLVSSVPAVGVAEESYRFTIPERGWTVGLELPALNRYQAQSERGRFRMMGQSDTARFVVSIHVEPTESSTSSECRTEYWAKASGNPVIVGESVKTLDISGNPSTSYRMDIEHEGEKFSTQNTNTYVFHDGTCVDVHLSIFPDATEADLATLRGIASSVSVAGTP